MRERQGQVESCNNTSRSPSADRAELCRPIIGTLRGDNGFQVVESQLTWIPQNEMELDAEKTVTVMKLLERLEELDDVQGVSSNLSLSDEAIAAFEAS